MLSIRLTALLAATTTTLASPIPGTERVVIVDVDGLRREALYGRLLNNPQLLPNISEIVLGPDSSLSTNDERIPPLGQYVAAKHATTAFPSYTFACQASLYTGNWPATHGITGNEFFDRDIRRRFGFSGGSVTDPKDITHTYEYDPIYDDSESSICDWLLDPIGQSHPAWGGLANLQLWTPTLYDAASAAGISSVVAFNMYSSTAHHEDDNISWVVPTPDDLCTYQLGNAWDYDAAMVDALLATLGTEPPYAQIITAYFAGHDHYCHGFDTGVDTDEQAQKWYLTEAVDPLMGRLIRGMKERGIYDDAVFVFTADHGHTNVIANDRHSIVMEDELEESIEDYTCDFFLPCFDVFDRWDWFWGDDFSAYVAQNSGAAHIYLRNLSTDNWSDFPETADLRGVAKQLARYHYGATDAEEPADGPIYPSDRVELILVRDPNECPDEGWSTPYKVWVDSDQPLADLAIWLDEHPDDYNYVEPLLRIEKMNCMRSGDIVFVPAQDEHDPELTWYADYEVESTHGSLYPLDSYIPFIVAGPPLAGRTRLVGSAAIVDVAPTVADILEFDDGGMDGVSLLQ